MPDVDQASVSALLTQMATSPDGGGQIVQNMLNESKLPAEYVVIILDDLKNHDDGKALRDTYERACRKCQLKGPVITCARPQTLGRTISEDKYLDILVRNHISEKDKGLAKAFLEKALAAPSLSGQKARLKDSPLGQYLIWATFNEADGSRNPFEGLAFSADDLRDMLAIDQGTSLKGTPLLLIIYDPPDTLDLRFPTIADAEWYPYFRPTPDGSDRNYGYTQSCHPVESGRPEVVHEVVHSDLLSHPIRRVV
jgi:hypothetical protein